MILYCARDATATARPTPEGMMLPRRMSHLGHPAQLLVLLRPRGHRLWGYSAVR